MSKIPHTTLIFATLLLFGGCDRSLNEPVSEEPPATGVAEQSPGYLRLPVNGAVTTLDPGLTEDVASIELTEQLFLALTYFNPLTYKVEPELATHWEVFDDGRRYRFYLREDVFWNDGTPVTADDVAWAIRRNFDPATQSPYAFALSVLTNASMPEEGAAVDTSALGVRAIDPYILEFELQQPISHFPILVSLWVYRPLPRHAIEQWGEDWTLPDKLISNGPYYLADWQFGRQLTLRKNPYYYDTDQVRIEEIQYLTIVDSNLGLTMYEDNELDIMGGLYLPLPRASLQTIQGDPALRAQYRALPTLCSETYAFNTRLAPMDDVRVRRAISAAIDRDLLVDIFMQGAGRPSAAFVPPLLTTEESAKGMTATSAARGSNGVGIGFNPDQARSWLSEAGYPEGKDFPPITLVHNRSEKHEKVALVVKKMLQHTLGITLEPQSLSWQDYLQAIEQPATPHLFRFGWCADYPDPYSWLSAVVEPSMAEKRLGWTDRGFNEQLKHIVPILDPLSRQQAYAQLERKLVNEETLLLPLYIQTAQYLVKPWVGNWSAVPFGGQSIKDWHLSNTLNP